MAVESLVVCQTNPWPITSGARRRIALLGEALSECGPVDIFYIAGPNARALGDVPSWVRHIGRTPKPRLPRLGSYARAYRRGMPQRFGGARAELEAAEQDALNFVDGTRYDIVLVVRQETLQFVSGLLRHDGALHVVDVDDVQDRKLVLQRTHLRSRGVRRTLASAVLRTETAMWRRMHRRLAAQGTLNLVCTPDDAQHLLSFGVRSHVVPNAYSDPERTPTAPRGHGHAVFLGSPYLPNRKALQFLCRSVVPRVRRDDPEFSLHVIGRLNGPAHDGVVYHGFVEDLGGYLNSSSLAVIPIFEQSGTSIKVLDAAARGTPIVATDAAVRGTGFHAGVHYLRADTADEFISAIRRLRSDPDEAARVATNARAHVTQRFSPHVVQREFVGLVTAALNSRRLNPRPGNGARSSNKRRVHAAESG